MSVRILPSGTRALLMELDSLEQVLAYYTALKAADLPVLDLVPAGRTILVVADRGTELTSLAEQLHRIAPARPADRQGAPIEIPVRYDGADLSEVAGLLGCSTAELVRRHSGQEWRVAFCGFAPGFGYLTGTDSGWDVPRRSSPRTRVPPRSVALAGEFTGIYPRESPGGWQLIGHSLIDVFDLDRDPPALLVPGASVRFVESR